MDYVEWCEAILRTLREAGDESPQFRNYGMDEDRLARRVWGDRYEQIAERLKTAQERDILYNAAFDLYKALLVEDANATFLKLTWEGRKAARDIFPVWENICLIALEPVLERALKIVNAHSPVSGDHFASVRDIPVGESEGGVCKGCHRAREHAGQRLAVDDHRVRRQDSRASRPARPEGHPKPDRAAPRRLRTAVR
jgi:hypothetical protein